MGDNWKMESNKLRMTTICSIRGDNLKMESHNLRITATSSKRGDNWKTESHSITEWLQLVLKGEITRKWNLTKLE